MNAGPPEHQVPNEPELHLFIVWEKASSERVRIFESLRQRFIVLQAFEITWTPAYFSRNLTLFYETHLPPGSDKEAHCGTGPFTLVVVLDPAPRYTDRPTLRGTRRVNRNTFDAKTLFRAWTDGGHRIHATDTAEETAHDLALLLGLTPEAFRDAYPGPWGGRIIPVRRDIPGATGWNSLDELFAVVNWGLTYVVLDRPDQAPALSPPDQPATMELLVDSYRFACALLGIPPVSSARYGTRMHVPHAGSQVVLRLRTIGDGHLDARWQQDILDRRVLTGRGFYALRPADQFYTSLYRMLLHGHEVDGEAAARLAAAGRHLGLSGIEERSSALKDVLDRYMVQQGYRYTEPRDLSLPFNRGMAGRSFYGFRRTIHLAWTALFETLTRQERQRQDASV